MGGAILYNSIKRNKTKKTNQDGTERHFISYCIQIGAKEN